MLANTTGYENTAIGALALIGNTTGYKNVAIGPTALEKNTSGYGNTVVGSSATEYNTTGYYNTALGYVAMWANSTGYRNTACGVRSMYYNTTGSNNTAIGYSAMEHNTIGQRNVCIGEASGFANVIGNDITAIGYNSLAANVQGSRITVIGSEADVSHIELTNATAIGYGAIVNGSNKVVIGNTSVTSIGGFAGWSNFSDARFKRNVRDNVPGLDFIQGLRPVTYTLDIAGINAFNNPAIDTMNRTLEVETGVTSVVHSGFMAQEVEKLALTLDYDFNGVDRPENPETQTYTLRYSEFVVPLVKAVQEQQAMIESQQEQIDELRALVLTMAQR